LVAFKNILLAIYIYPSEHEKEIESENERKR